MSDLEKDKQDQEFIGNRIKEARLDAGLTTDALSSLIKVSEVKLLEYEAGINCAPQEVVVQISLITKKDYDWFFK